MCEGYIGKVKIFQWPSQRKTLGEGFVFLFIVCIEIARWNKKTFLVMFPVGKTTSANIRKFRLIITDYWQMCSSFLQWALCTPRLSVNLHGHFNISEKQKKIADKDGERETTNQFSKEIATIVSSVTILCRSLSESVSIMSTHIAMLLWSSQEISYLMLQCKVSTLPRRNPHQNKKPNSNAQ